MTNTLNLGLVIMMAWVLAGQIVSGFDKLLLSATSSKFSQNLYQEVALDKENIVYSPYSIHSTLTLAFAGANGVTKDEMANALCLDELQGQSPHESYRDLISQMASVTEVTLDTGNAIFVNPHYSIEDDFEILAKEEYFSLVTNFDLDDPKGPEYEINQYVANRTHNRITNIIGKGNVNHMTLLVLVNTLFFNGTWQTQFDKSKTKKQTFFTLNGGTTEVDMMDDARWMEYKKDDDLNVQVAKLPFLNPRFALYIVLPHEVSGIIDLERQLQTSNLVDNLCDDMKTTRVALKIPNFKIDTSLDLNQPLKNLGMNGAFDSAADFSGITPKQVFISSVVHKATIEVCETGTVAAAANVVHMILRSGPPRPTARVEADHPFMFFLRDTDTKQILFQGKFSG